MTENSPMQSLTRRINMQLETTKRVFVYDQSYNKLEKNYQ